MNEQKPIKVILVLGLFSFLSALSGSSTSLAIPKIALSLEISSGLATWVLQSGLITTTIFLVAFGHMGDLLSKNFIFFSGGIAFTIGSAITGIAPTFSLIIIGRIIQAFGSSMIMANSMGIVSDYFPDKKRAQALSYISMFISAGSISGPAAGGFIMSVASWRWIYLINVPLMIAVLIFGHHALPIPKVSIKQLKSATQGANWMGQGLFTAGIIIFFLSGAIFQSRSNWLIGLITLVVGGALTIYSFYQDDVANLPWISPKILHNRPYLVSIMALLLVMLVNSVSNILLPFYFQSYGLMTPFQSGLLIMLQSLVMLVLSPFAGYLADRVNRQLMTIIGLVILTVSQIGYLLYPAGMNLTRIIIPIVINGIGMAFFLSPNNALTMGLVDKSLTGIAGSLNSFSRTIGMTIGISFGSSILFALLPNVDQITPALGETFLSAFRGVFYVAIAISSLASIMVFVRYLRAKKTA